MKCIKVFSSAFLLLGWAAIGSTAGYAETLSQEAGVTVVRGEDSADRSAQRQTTRGRAGVVVFRGQSSAAPAAQSAPTAVYQEPPRQIVGGENLWIHDPQSGDVTACSLRYDFYGNRTVRCSSDRY